MTRQAAADTTISADDVAPADTVLRLRPVVHASPVARGLRVSGSRSGFTESGGPKLWLQWRALAEALAEGQPAERLRQLSGQWELDSLIAQLAEHDMLVEVPAGWGLSGDQAGPPGHIARWLEAVAPDPVSAWQALRRGPLAVQGTGRVASAAFRALRAAGIQATAFATAELLAKAVPAVAAASTSAAHAEAGVVRAGGIAVAAMAGREVAVVTPAGRPQAVRAELAAIADRVGLDGTGRVPHVLAALAGGAAVHRLICAVAGLPDPGHTVTPALSGTPALAGSPEPGGPPGILVARLDPLRVSYHPWPDPVWTTTADLASHPDETAGSAGPVEASAVPGDADRGVMPRVVLADLPGLPAVLARCQAVRAIGADAGAARLAAAAGWCAHTLEAALPDRALVAVGASRPQADEILLRRLVDRRTPARASSRGTEVGEAEWAGSARARLWWKAITLRFAASVTMRVTRLADGVFHAAVDLGAVRIGWAVEPTPSDAAAYAALTAVAALECQAQPAPVLVPACGARAAADSRGGIASSAQDGDRDDFARVLRGLLSGQPITVLGPVAGSGAVANLVRALDTAGFVAVTAAPS